VDGAHDLGGMHGFGAVVVPGGDDVFHEPWERRVFAIQMLIGYEELGAGPGGRATREEMEPAEYLAASYYERWLFSARTRLERAGRLAPGELEEKAEELRAGATIAERLDPGAARRIVEQLAEGGRLPMPELARFAPGDRVRVRRMRPVVHTRCPRYVRGASGVVERVQCADRLPELDTYGVECDREPVYAVSFGSRALWGETAEPPFTVLVDLWESYLEAA
jgi:nitrile hydratase